MATTSFTLPALNSRVAPYENATPYSTAANNNVPYANAEPYVASSWKNPDNYNIEAESTSSFWSDSGNLAQDIASDVWNWANTDTGTAVVGGAISGAASMYSQGLAEDAASEISDDNMAMTQMKIDSAERMQAAELAQQMKMKMLEEKRIDTHNTSINNPDVKMNVRKWK